MERQDTSIHSSRDARVDEEVARESLNRSRETEILGEKRKEGRRRVFSVDEEVKSEERG